MTPTPPVIDALAPRLSEADGALVIEGHASLWGRPDRTGDVVERGAFARSLADLAARGEVVRMLWQHDPAQPIGAWDEVREDATGLFVRGRLLTGVARAAEAAALLRGGAIDGLSIGYRATKAAPGPTGRRLIEVELWEVSLVTFPMLREARVEGKAALPLAPATAAIRAARHRLRMPRR